MENLQPVLFRKSKILTRNENNKLLSHSSLKNIKRNLNQFLDEYQKSWEAKQRINIPVQTYDMSKKQIAQSNKIIK